jgi:glycopeptide antibiotics resistance protein
VSRLPPRRARVALAAWVSVTLFVVVPWYAMKGHPHWDRAQWIPFVTPPIRLRDLVANALFYVPFGFLYLRAASHPRVWKAVCAGLALSFFTELTQLFSHGRFPSTTDLILNTFGAACGAVWAASRRSDARR